MCYSARVQQHLRNLSRRYSAHIDWAMFQALFSARMQDPQIRIARALESNFEAPQTDAERQIKARIDAYREQQAEGWQSEIFRQKKRLADAQRTLQAKETQKARNDARIAAEKIARNLERLADLRRTETSASDSQIFPKYYVPIIVQENDQRLIRPMRYQCRLPGKPASYDTRYPGCYNARRDSLSGFWEPAFGSHHAIMIVHSFFEYVPTHRYEKRELAPGEKEKSVVLHFNPQPQTDMIAACLWSHWTGGGEPELYSFAAITDEPPPQVAATGHDRCIVTLKEENIAAWLDPETLSNERLQQILGDRECPVLEHRIAA